MARFLLSNLRFRFSVSEGTQTMAIEWYYSEAGQKRGPVSSAILKEMVAMGDLKPETLIWKDGLSEWVPAQKVKGLFPKDAPPVPPPIREPEPPIKIKAETPIQIKIERTEIGLTATIAKWVTIVWSVVCLAGVFFGLANVGSDSSLSSANEYEQAGATLGIGCGMFIWVFFWAAIALPALVIWVVAQRK
jgi:hypothetical protein